MDVGSLVFFFDVSTTAGYTPPITICGRYPDDTNDGIVDGTGIQETTLKLLHDAGGAGNFQPVVNQTIDTNQNRICGEVMSLSPFLLASEGVSNGFVPPDSVARKCESKVLKQSANPLKAVITCNRKTAEASFRGQTFDSAACEAEARAQYDDKIAGLSGCPACLLTNASDVGDVAEGAAEALTNGLYCAGTTLLGGEDLGFVPPDAATALCAKQQGKHAAKLGKNLAKCHREHVDAVFKAQGSDLDACLAEANAAYDNAVDLVAGCPACASASAPVTRNTVERFSVEILSGLYCAGTTALA